MIDISKKQSPVAELSSVRTSAASTTRVAGLLKGQVSWESDAFDPMTDEEFDQFDQSSIIGCGTTSAAEEA
ncbi:MAG: hypothetical protein U0R19_06465 [Bryobacteraceae bacterium]